MRIMVRCNVCGNECPEYGSKILTVDGDVACSDACAKKWKAGMDHFLNVTIHDDDKYNEWMGL